ncbi:hypothetical protein T492DRAFT_870962 [Pavlovales sp. CCMP2436]|nr:hypothetical protein T492DRAFT_870962 [Pavlovales sp. CCMP2436]
MYVLMGVSPMEAAARIKKQLIDTIGTIAAHGHAQLLLARLSALTPIAAQHPSARALQAAAWAAMLLARPQPGGLLAWLPRPWLAAACTVDPLAVLEWSSEQACESWALLELWWGAGFIGLSRAEIDDALHAGALPRSLHRWLHRPFFAQLPPALLDALTADPAARAF